MSESYKVPPWNMYPEIKYKHPTSDKLDRIIELLEEINSKLEPKVQEIPVYDDIEIDGRRIKYVGEWPEDESYQWWCLGHLGTSAFSQNPPQFKNCDWWYDGDEPLINGEIYNNEKIRAFTAESLTKRGE